MAAVLGNSTHSDLDGFPVMRTRCANVSGPPTPPQGDRAWNGGCGFLNTLPCVGGLQSFSAGCGEALWQATLWPFPQPSFLLALPPSNHLNREATRLSSGAHCYLCSVPAFAELQQGLSWSGPSLFPALCDELLSMLHIGDLRKMSFEENKFCCLSKESENHC